MLPDDGFEQLYSRLFDQFITVAQNVDARPHYRRASDGMAISAREIWWPTLRLLQELKTHSASLTNEQLTLLIGKWTALGAALNLDIAIERQRHEREARRRCAWHECQFHRVSVPEGIELKTCSGCHDARYCGRRCQRRYVKSTVCAKGRLLHAIILRDWSQGGHRERCRRLT